MKPRIAAATTSRPNRILVALAAAWIILSLAIGGAVSAGDSPPPAQQAAVTGRSAALTT